MLRSLVLSALLFVAAQAFAQNSAVTNAILYFQEGNVAKAKEEIDLAVVNDKTRKSAKAWYYRGLIYETIAHNADANITALSTNAVEEANLSWNNAILYDTVAKKEFARKAKEDRIRIWPDYVNKGTDYLKQSKYEEAMNAYDVARNLNPKDTIAFTYAALAAVNKPDYVRLDIYADTLFRYTSGQAALYQYKATTSREVRKDTTEAIRWCMEGLKKFPGNESLSREAAWMLAATGQPEKAIALLEPFIKYNGKNHEFLMFMAGLYDKTGDYEKAKALYQQLVGLNPNDGVAWYNLSALQFNQANELWAKGQKEEAKALFRSCQSSIDNALRNSNSAADQKTLNYMSAEVKKKLAL